MLTSLRCASALALCAVLGTAGGCTTSARNDQLENVAKDWCLTIRASQVIPVYPPTEDLVPGDVFLVQTPVPDQVAVYERDGFIPLDQHVTRLANLDFGRLYHDAYWTGDYDAVPHPRPHRDVVPDPADDSGFVGVRAPRAAFPSYRFEVRSGVAAELAIPVQGVPVGLGFMQAGSATGSITISDAYTYALDTEQLLGGLRRWAAAPAVRNELAALDAAHDTPLYLRVVARVYLTGQVVVALANTDERAFGGDAGAPRAISIPTVTDQATAENYQHATTALSEAINEGLPGASIRVAQASDRSITMSEAFDRPLVIGYLGFDVPIGHGGTLGAPVATLDRLEARAPNVRAIDRTALTAPERAFRWRILELRGERLATQLRVANDVVSVIGYEPSFAGVSDALADAATGTADDQRGAVQSFIDAASDYVSLDGGESAHHADTMTRLLDTALTTGGRR